MLYSVKMQPTACVQLPVKSAATLTSDPIVMKESSDHSLVEAALEGDTEAFVRLVTKHKKRVIGLAGRFTGIREEMDDICQDVFLKAYAHLRSYKKNAPFEHWLSRITVNTCYDYLRKKKHVKTFTECGLVYDIADLTLDERSEAEEAYRMLYRALVRLKPPERLVITLLELEEKSLREVADLTGWSIANVKVRAYRARKILRRIIKDEEP
jgi:RNA polymerase sigma-70 factor (ECF subfamily)